MYGKACCAECAAGGLGALPRYSSYGSPSFGLDFGFPSYGGFPSPGGSFGYTSPVGGITTQQYNADRKWYDPIVGFLGDVGSEAIDLVKSYIKQRIGEAAWDNMPEESKQAAVRSAWEDVRAQVPLLGVPPAVLIAGGVLLFLLFSKTR